MRNLSRVVFVLVLLLLVTSIAAAGGPELGPFSTTGYTTNLNPEFDINSDPGPDNKPFLPFDLLPSGHIEFYISAEGSFDDEICKAVVGKPCGTAGFFDEGSFTFEEWGVYYPPASFAYVPDLGIPIGANHGLLSVATTSGEADMRFGGQAVITNPSTPEDVSAIGSFSVLDGTEGYKKLKGQGSYDGEASIFFTVPYTPCEGKNCSDQCAAFGDMSLKVKKDKIEWRIENSGKDDLTVSSITLNWLGSESPLEKVKFGGKTLAQAPIVMDPIGPFAPGHYSVIDTSGWTGKDKDIQIKSGKDRKLTFEFEEKEISQEQSDYTILVQFAEGCAVTFVAF